ncbi:MAG: fumarylacetoacetate hydrolase family protein [Betaproteobacteria bacterium]|jgi:2-keto-4-pentenoate hydratase
MSTPTHEPHTDLMSGASGALDHTAAARLLWQHRETGKSLDALPAPLRPTDQAAGHAIQAMLPAVTGRGVAGWKIAATSAAGQAHIGVSGPLAGRVLEGLVDGDGDVVSLSGNLMCVAEPEFAFRFGRPLTPRPSLYTVSEVLEAVDAVLPSIEVPNSRFHDFARAGEAQLIADDACAHRFAIGSPTATDWRAIDLRMHRVHAEVRGADGSLRDTREGDGTAVLGDPRVALTWLVNELSALGVALEPGQFVSTGTCMVPLEVQPGDQVEVSYGALGRLSLRFRD